MFKSKKFISMILNLAVVTGIFFTIYIVEQQQYRTSANDPQIQIAEDVAAALDSGVDPATISSDQKMDMQKSISPFFIVYDSNSKVVASTVSLNNTTPVPPMGILNYARAHGENRITWQPQAGVRIASVVMPYKSGFVLAGRSLRETEKRIDQLGSMVGLAWIAAMALLVIKWVLKGKRKKEKS